MNAGAAREMLRWFSRQVLQIAADVGGRCSGCAIDVLGAEDGWLLVQLTLERPWKP